MKRVRLRPLMIVAFLNETAYSMMWPLATIYLNTILHKSLTVTGTALFCFSVANVVGSVLMGKLYDQYNQFLLTITGMISCVLICLVGIWLDGWPAYPIILTIFGFTSGWLTTAINVYGTLISGQSTTQVFNKIYLVLNVGLVVGTMIISEIFQKSIAPIFIFATGIYAFSLIMLLCFFPRQRVKYPDRPVSRAKIERRQQKGPAPSLFTVSFLTLVVVWMMYSQWESNFSVYLLDMGFKLRVYSILWALNGAVIIIVQSLLTRFPKMIANLFDRVNIGLSFLAISYFITVASHQVIYIYLGMILLTIGEAIYVPSVPVIIDNWSAPRIKGRNQGLVSGFSSIGRALGPLFGGFIIDHSSFRVLFIIAGIAMLVVTILNYLNNLHYKKVQSL